MKRSIVVPLLIAIPLTIAGCGGSSATPRTAAGVKSDYLQFAKLVSAGNGAAACSRYISPTIVAELSAAGGCAKVIDYAVAQHGGLDPSTVANGWTATVTGTRGTYQTAKASGTEVYVDGHWVFAEDSSSGANSRLAEDASAKELARTVEVAIETYATDHSGSYAGATPATLKGIESIVQVGPGSNNAYVAASGVTATAGAYTVTATAANGTDRFSVVRAANGLVTRTCLPVGQAGCSASGAW